MIRPSNSSLPDLRNLSFVVLLVLPGCGGRELMPTPNIYVGREARNPFAQVPVELRGSEVDILYVTDREARDPARTGGGLAYGPRRSRALAFGSCRVRIGPEDLTWEELVADSRTHQRKHKLPLSMVSIREEGRLPATPLDLVETAEGWTVDPDELRREAEATEALVAGLRRRLALTSKKEVFVYVHGVANSFEFATFTVAEFWHFFGRQGVPVVFSWPADGSYHYDRESGEFATFHLKQFLRIAASLPEVEKLHLIAHSRGTDVAITAIRELFIEARAAQEDIREKYKIDNMVLAAPDLDFGVLQQRVSSENFGPVVGRFTVYSSGGDWAIGLVSWLFSSHRRLGQIRSEDLTEGLKKRLAITKDAYFVDADVSSSFIGHSYFHDDPAVSSDVVLTLSEDRDPGFEHGRPLIPVDVGYWRLEDNYCLSEEE